MIENKTVLFDKQFFDTIDNDGMRDIKKVSVVVNGKDTYYGYIEDTMKEHIFISQPGVEIIIQYAVITDAKRIQEDPEPQ